MKQIFTIIISFICLNGMSQIYFQNDTNEPVYVAFCMKYKSKSYDYFGSKGWFKIEPGDRKEVSNAIGLNDNIYYYAYSSISEKEYTGDVNLLVHPTDKFFIKNADKSYQKKENSEYEWKKFRHVEMNAKALQLKYTIKLKY